MWKFKTKVMVALIIQGLLSGCIHSITLPLHSQIKNMGSRVCPMPMPSCKAAFEWDNDIEWSYSKSEVNTSSQNQEEITVGKCLMKTLVVSVYFSCIVLPCAVSDLAFSPYNVPAYLYYKDDKGDFELRQEDGVYILCWKGLLANRIVRKLIVKIDSGYVEFLGKALNNEVFKQRIDFSQEVEIEMPISCLGYNPTPTEYRVSCLNEKAELSDLLFYKEINIDDNFYIVTSDDFKGSITLLNDHKLTDNNKECAKKEE